MSEPIVIHQNLVISDFRVKTYQQVVLYGKNLVEDFSKYPDRKIGLIEVASL